MFPQHLAGFQVGRPSVLGGIASGGIHDIDDVKGLLEAGGIWGAITGKAIYSGSLDVQEAIELTKTYGV